jgi:hypothetical protein
VISWRAVPLLIAGIGLGAACTAASEPTTEATTTTEPPVATTTIPAPATTTTAPATTTTTTTLSPYARPPWLGTQLLPLRADDHGEVLPTPPELQDRQLETIDLLPPPAGDEFVSTASPVPDTVQARSSWVPGCPVGYEELTYLTVSHLGFDGRFHTGEIIVNAAVAQDVVEVFRRLHEARFPIEQMRVIRLDEVDEPPTGDGNITTSFTCRTAVGSEGWSFHAYGLAIDINPFHNPYAKADLVLPELASAYLDRSDLRPGMIEPGDAVTEAFAEIGWRWGGNWVTLKDWMHFSRDGG